MKIKFSKENFGLRFFSYFMTILFAIAILFPLCLTISYSLKDDIKMYDSPPKILPDSAKSIDLIFDYSLLKDNTPAQVLDEIKKDATVAMYSTIYEIGNEGIQEVKFYGVIDGKSVFYSRAHKMDLQAQTSYGIYATVRITRDILLLKDKYLTSTDKIGYDFDLNGLNKKMNLESDENIFHNQVKDFLTNKYGMTGSFLNTSLTKNNFLLLENYKHYFLMPTYVYGKTSEFIKKFSFFAFMFNTIFVVGTAVLLQIFQCSITGFALSKMFGKRTANLLLLFFMGSLMVPFITIMIPQLIMFRKLGFYNNYAALIVPNLYPYAFFIYLYKSFFDKLPISLFEAAKVDGASNLYTYVKICMPLSKPIISVIALQAFLGSWNDFFWPYLVTENQRLWTLNVALFNLAGSSSIKQNFIMGLSVVSSLPVILIAIIFSEQIKRSIATSGIKE